MAQIKLSGLNVGDVLELVHPVGNRNYKELGYLHEKKLIFKIRTNLRHPKHTKKQARSHVYDTTELEDILVLSRGKPILDFDKISFGTPVEVEFFSEYNLYTEIGYVTEITENSVYTFDKDPNTFPVNVMARQRYIRDNIKNCYELTRPATSN